MPLEFSSATVIPSPPSLHAESVNVSNVPRSWLRMPVAQAIKKKTAVEKVRILAVDQYCILDCER